MTLEIISSLKKLGNQSELSCTFVEQDNPELAALKIHVAHNSSDSFTFLAEEDPTRMMVNMLSGI